MFIGNSCHDCIYNQLEMKNVDKNILGWFEDIIDENKCKIERKEWKSKYNSYVVYDYEPFIIVLQYKKEAPFRCFFFTIFYSAETVSVSV